MLHRYPLALTLTLLSAAFCSLVPSAVRANAPAAVMETGSDGPQPAACLRAPARRLEAEVRRLAAGRAPRDAWRVTRVLLCDDGPGARRVIASRLAASATSRVDGAPESTATLDRDSDEIAHGYARGLAWGADAHADGRDIAVLFWTGETCFAGFTLRFDGKRWRVADLDGGCD